MLHLTPKTCHCCRGGVDITAKKQAGKQGNRHEEMGPAVDKRRGQKARNNSSTQGSCSI